MPSPLEDRRLEGFNLRPFRVLLRFLKKADDEGLVGLTKAELALFVITTLSEDALSVDAAWQSLTHFRTRYAALKGNVTKKATQRRPIE
ncbi:MAG: hypothetical protein HC853_08490 [Anaerolineae bacterium]|nr:hypothetical protein [Anaerolineae bacterium]